MIREFLEWISLRDYDEALNRAASRIVARYSRGNTSVQDGRIIDEKDLESLAQKADIAIAHLIRKKFA